MSTPDGIAKVTWEDPETLQRREYVLIEGATASIGRSVGNDVIIPQKHVSRQHAVITFRDGIFMISDLGSANGTFVNDRRLTDPFPLAHGDVIRLYVPTLQFSAVVSEEEQENARKTGTLILPRATRGDAKLLVTVGVQEGVEFPLVQETITVGRDTQGAQWDIKLKDPAVSRPHCKLVKQGTAWAIIDLESVNGTLLNGSQVSSEALTLKDGDVLTIGETTLLYRSLAATQRVNQVP
ncbi:MAG: FHA domain-containing protein [Anaerolineae bacterium]|nr:FHA domain-containing protein [Anaerolineae bacterium]